MIRTWLQKLIKKSRPIRRRPATFRPWLEGLEVRCVPAGMQTASIFTVTSAGDDPGGPSMGVVTLRDAITSLDNDAHDSAAKPDVINFQIPGTPTINLSAALPAITNPVLIDGSTQPGVTVNGQGMAALDVSAPVTEQDVTFTNGLVIVNSGGSLSVNGALNLGDANGDATGVQNFGNLVVNGPVTGANNVNVTNYGTATMTVGGDFTMGSGCSLDNGQASTDDATLVIHGNCSFGAGGLVEDPGTSTIHVTGNLTLGDDVLNFNNANDPIPSNATQGVYLGQFTNTNANATLGAATLTVDGALSGTGNLIVDAFGQSTLTVGQDFIVPGEGYVAVGFAHGDAAALSVGGNFSLGSSSRFFDDGDATTSVTGNFTMSSGTSAARDYFDNGYFQYDVSNLTIGGSFSMGDYSNFFNDGTNGTQASAMTVGGSFSIGADSNVYNGYYANDTVTLTVTGSFSLGTGTFYTDSETASTLAANGGGTVDGEMTIYGQALVNGSWTVDGEVIIYGYVDPDTFTVEGNGNVTVKTHGTFIVNGMTITGNGLVDVYGDFTDEGPLVQQGGGQLKLETGSLDITITPYDVPYDGTSHSATGTAVASGTFNLSGLLSFSPGHTDAGDYTDTWTFAGNTTFASASGTVNDQITQAQALISIQGVSTTYDGDSHATTGTATGVESPNPADLTGLLQLYYSSDGGLTFSSSAPVNAGAYEIYYTFAGNTDYQAITSYADSGQAVDIAKADAHITVNPYDVTFDGNAHMATGSVTGVVGTAGAGAGAGKVIGMLDLTHTLHITANNYPNDMWFFTDLTGNYNNASGAIDDVINPAGQTINFTPPTSPINFAANEMVTLNATGGASGNPVVFTIDPTSTGAGTITGNVLDITTPGTFIIDANQAGNGNYLAAKEVQEILVVNAKVTPIISATPGGTVVIGTGVHMTDTATLAGGNNPTGTITFTLYGPADSVVDTEIANVNGNNSYSTPTGYLPSVPGTYQWVACYGGDGSNFGVSTTKGSSPEIAVGSGVTLVGSALYLVGGTNGNDRLNIQHVGPSNTGSTGIQIQGQLNGVNLNNPPPPPGPPAPPPGGPPAPPPGPGLQFNPAPNVIYIVGFNGNNNVNMENNLSVPAIVTEGNGNDNVQLGNGNNTVVVGNGNDQVQLGNGYNSVMLGNGNDDVQVGNNPPPPPPPGGAAPANAGSDIVMLGNGNDNVQLGNGNNTVVVGAGNDNVQLGSGNNSVSADTGNTPGPQPPGNDSVQAGSGNNIVTLGNNNANVQLGSGTDTVTGGNGNDNVQAGNNPPPPPPGGAAQASPGNDIVMLGNGNDNIQFGNGNNSASAGNGNDQVQLGNGNNIVTLGNGNDHVQGPNAPPPPPAPPGAMASLANDSVTAGNGNDNVQLGNGNSSVTLGNGNDQVQLGNGNNSVTAGSGNLNIHAGDGTNLINAGAAASQANIQVQLGNGASNSVNLLGNGNDQVQAGNGNGDFASITGNGNDQIQLGNGNSDAAAIVGNGNDQIQLGNGNSDVAAITGNGNDQIQLGNGNGDSATLYSNGNDNLQIGNGTRDSAIVTGNGNDNIQTGNGAGSTLKLRGTGHDNVHLGNGWSEI